MLKSKKMLNLLLIVSMLSLASSPSQVVFAETEKGTKVETPIITREEKNRKVTDLVDYAKNLKFAKCEGDDKQRLIDLTDKMKEERKNNSRLDQSNLYYNQFIFEDYYKKGKDLTVEDMKKMIDAKNIFSYLVVKKLENNKELENIIKDYDTFIKQDKAYMEFYKIEKKYMNNVTNVMATKMQDSNKNLEEYWNNMPKKERILSFINLYFHKAFEIDDNYNSENFKENFNNWYLQISFYTKFHEQAKNNILNAINEVNNDLKKGKFSTEDFDEFKEFAKHAMEYELGAPTEWLKTEEVIKNMTDDEKIAQLEYNNSLNKWNKKYILNFENIDKYEEYLKKRIERTNKDIEKYDKYIKRLEEQLNKPDNNEIKKDIINKRIEELKKNRDSLDKNNNKDFELLRSNDQKFEEIRAKDLEYLLERKEILDDIAKFKESKNQNKEDINLKNKLLAKFDETYKRKEKEKGDSYKEKVQKEIKRVENLNFDDFAQNEGILKKIQIEEMTMPQMEIDYSYEQETLDAIFED